MGQEPALDIVVRTSQFGEGFTKSILHYVRYGRAILVPHPVGDIAGYSVHMQAVQVSKGFLVASLGLVQQGNDLGRAVLAVAVSDGWNRLRQPLTDTRRRVFRLNAACL